MPWVGAQPVTRKQRPAASVTGRPVPSVSRAVCTFLVWPVIPTMSSSLKKDPESPVHESDAYFSVKTNNGKSNSVQDFYLGSELGKHTRSKMLTKVLCFPVYMNTI